MVKRIYLSPPDLTGNEIEYVMQAFNSNWIAPLGPNVDKFENIVSEKIGIKAALALSSGTAAIHLALKYLGVSRDDIVFCSTLTFSGSCNPIAYQGAVPVFIDSEPDSWNMSPIALKKAILDAVKSNKLPKAVIIVNLYGQSADMDKLISICSEYNIPIIEDAAESLGAYYKGKSSGTFGKFGVFSFNGNKIVTSSGGGMLVSNDKEAIAKCRFWATQSREKFKHYEHKEIGYNYRLSNILAGIGIGQFEQIDQKIAKRKGNYDFYKNALSDIQEISLMPIPNWSNPNYWLSVIQIDEISSLTPEIIIDKLEENNIESRPVWKPMHIQPVFAEAKFFSHLGNGSVSEKLFNRGICLPSGTGLTPDEKAKIVDVIKSCFTK